MTGRTYDRDFSLPTAMVTATVHENRDGSIFLYFENEHGEYGLTISPQESAIDASAAPSVARSSVYAIRPMICRLWGICEGMPCPWGCKPEPRYLTTLESYDLLLRAELISQPEHADEINAERERYRANPDLIALAELFHVKPKLVG